MTECPEPLKTYNCSVYLTEVFEPGTLCTRVFDNLTIDGELRYFIHPNLKKLEAYPCTPHDNETSSPTDIVVSTLDGSVRFGDGDHITPKGNVMVLQDPASLADTVPARNGLYVHRDKDACYCVVYTAGEDPDVHYHGTCVVASNFIEPNDPEEISDEPQALDRPGCVKIEPENGAVRNIHVKGSMFVDYYMRSNVVNERAPDKTWFVIDCNREQWFQPPDGVKNTKRPDGSGQPEPGDLVISKGNASVLLTARGGVHAKGPVWVLVGNRSGDVSTRFKSVVVLT